MEEQFQQSMHHHHHQSYPTGPPMMTHGHHDYRNDIDMSNKMIDDMRMNMPMTMVKSEPPIHPHYLCAPQIDHSHRLHYPVSPVWQCFVKLKFVLFLFKVRAWTF